MGRRRGWVSAYARTRGGWIPPCARTRGKDFTPILAFPHQGGRKKRRDGSPHPRGHEWGWVPVPVFTESGSSPAFTRGWVSACARTRVGKDFTPILAFPGSRLCEGKRRRDGSPHSRGHEWGRLHPHPSLPPSRGKGKERGWVPASARTSGGGRLHPPS